MEIAGRELPEGRWDWKMTAVETPPLVVAFEADAGGREPVSRLVGAERLEILPGLVPRHPRAGAKAAPGARDWPGPPLPTD
ncbi:hypothetical protein ACFWIO_27335 [Streptomyces diastatochromogenes]|uniref:hypothetical protein n=1 Tax=Streptomyces diastatochromogenes TaxID=42236 RepID=UPI00365A3EF1